MSPIHQTSFWVGTFFAVSYSKSALIVFQVFHQPCSNIRRGIWNKSTPKVTMVQWMIWDAINDMSKINNNFSFQTYFKMCDNKTLRQTLIFILKVIYIAIYKEFGRYVTIISTYLVAISTLDLVQLFRIQACNPSQAKL